MEKIVQKHAKKIRFVLVGGTNTTIDFGILFGLTFLGVDKIIANYISTSIALVFSFFANKSFTFKNTSKNAKRQFILFLVVTLIGLWILQPLIIWGYTSLLDDSPLSLFIAKLIATIVTLIWNYLFYSRVVFIEKQEG